MLARAVGNYIKAQRRDDEKKKTSLADTSGIEIDDQQLDDSIESSTLELDAAPRDFRPVFEQVSL